MNEAILPRGPFPEERKQDELTPELAEAVTHLAICRDDAQAMSDAALKLHEELAATDLGKRISQAAMFLDEVKQTAKKAEFEVRDLAVRLGARNDTNKPHPAIVIKEYTNAVIVDDYAALKFARLHIQQCVKLDWRKTKKLVKGGLDMPGVILEKELRATVARDLSKWLPPEEAEPEEAEPEGDGDGTV